MAAQVRTRLLLGLLLSLTVWTYLPSFTANFVYEDVKWLPTFDPAPLTTLAGLAVSPWTLAFHFSHGFPGPLHLFALVVHILNGWLLFSLLTRAISEDAALLAVGLFWLHPLNTEAVAYLTGAREAVVTLYILAAIRIGLWRWGLIASVALAALAVAAKPTGIVAPALIGLGLLALGVTVPKKWIWTGIAGAVVVGGWELIPFIVLRQGTVFTVGPSLEQVGLTAAALVRYLALIVVPFGFTVDHDWSLVPLALLGGAAGLLVLASVVLMRWRPWGAVLVLWLALALAPRFLVQQREVLNEHQVYLAFLPLWPVLAMGLRRLWRVATTKQETYAWLT